jgi:hypothetical protein
MKLCALICWVGFFRFFFRQDFLLFFFRQIVKLYSFWYWQSADVFKNLFCCLNLNSPSSLLKWFQYLFYHLATEQG